LFFVFFDPGPGSPQGPGKQHREIREPSRVVGGLPQARDPKLTKSKSNKTQHK
jgi:hypothetical protein